jgi:hypothetical protein
VRSVAKPSAGHGRMRTPPAPNAHSLRRLVFAGSRHRWAVGHPEVAPEPPAPAELHHFMSPALLTDSMMNTAGSIDLLTPLTAPAPTAASARPKPKRVSIPELEEVSAALSSSPPVRPLHSYAVAHRCA